MNNYIIFEGFTGECTAFKKEYISIVKAKTISSSNRTKIGKLYTSLFDRGDISRLKQTSLSRELKGFDVGRLNELKDIVLRAMNLTPTESIAICGLIDFRLRELNK